MYYFLNPISVGKEGRGFINFFCATIVCIVFIILLGITVNKIKKYKNVENESEEKQTTKKIISLIIADILILLFVIVVLILLNSTIY